MSCARDFHIKSLQLNSQANYQRLQTSEFFIQIANFVRMRGRELLKEGIVRSSQKTWHGGGKKSCFRDWDSEILIQCNLNAYNKFYCLGRTKQSYPSVINSREIPTKLHQKYFRLFERKEEEDVGKLSRVQCEIHKRNADTAIQIGEIVITAAWCTRSHEVEVLWHSLPTAVWRL